MNLFVLFFPAVAVLIAARIWSTPVLFAGWSFLITTLPVFRGYVGPIPVYAYDVAAMLVWSILLTRHKASWPRSAPPWAPIFIAVIAIFGTLVPMAIYGRGFAEMGWNLGHTGLAFASLIPGAFLISGATEREREGFRRGLVAGLIALAVIVALQKSSPTMNTFILQTFLGASDDVSDPRARYLLIAELITGEGRVTGPFNSPNTLGIAAIVAGVNYWLLTTYLRRRSVFDLVVAMCVVAAIFASASRQAILVVLIVGMAFVFQSFSQKVFVRLFIGGIVAAVIASLVGVDLYVDRVLALFEEGGEANVAARLTSGPQRLYDMMYADPWLFITGAGLEIHKLARFGLPVPWYILEGFVSNGFLLYLYYFGFVGFFAMTSFWIWVVIKGATAPAAIRPITMGVGFAFVFIVFADNHAVLAEELITPMMIFVGMMTAINYQLERQRRLAPVTAAPAVGETHAHRAGK